MVKSSFSYNPASKLKFWISYIYYRLIILKECKLGVKELYLAEIIWVFNQIFRLKIKLPDFLKREKFITKFGTFFIVPDLISIVTVSPAYEREDVNQLIKLMEKDVKRGKKVLFLDIGANFGLYTITIGKKFKDKVRIISFEPDASYITLPSYNLLKKNIKINKIKNIKTYKIGIGIKGPKKIKGQDFLVKKLSIIIGKKYLSKYDSVFIKLDVDEFVLDALKGIKDSVNESKELVLLVEDFVDKDVRSYLAKNYVFISKISPYNSFWKK